VATDIPGTRDLVVHGTTGYLVPTEGRPVFAATVNTSVAKGLALDGRGRLWVLTFLIQPNRFGGFDNQPDFSRCYRFDVFDSQGILRFSVAPPPVRFSGFSIWDDRMYLIDPGDESCVYEYRMIERD
jgi:hypothetical protein